MDTAVHFPTTPKGVQAAPLELSKRMSTERAFQAIARNCLEHIRANEEAVTRFQHAESLHQMRVGVRRLRAALGMFKDLLEAPPQLQQEIAWLADKLGPARDWDVLVESTLPDIDKASGAGGAVAEVAHAAQQKCDEFHRQAAVAVSSARYQHLVNSLSAWIDQRGWRATAGDKARPALKQRVTHFAAAILDQDQQRLLRRGRKLEDASAEQRHRVRIAAKRSRYAAEFFASLYPNKQVRPYVEALSTLQDELGALNDSVVAERLLEQLADDSEGIREGRGFIRGYLASRAEQRGRQVLKMWNKFVPVKAPR